MIEGSGSGSRSGSLQIKTDPRIPGRSKNLRILRIRIHNTKKMETLPPQSTRNGKEKEKQRIHQWKAGVEKYFYDDVTGTLAPGVGGGGGDGGGRRGFGFPK
jgi:hypothetical protein